MRWDLTGEPRTDENIRLCNLWHDVVMVSVRWRSNNPTLHDLVDGEPGAGHRGLSGVPVVNLKHLRDRSGVSFAIDCHVGYSEPATEPL